MIKVVAMLVSLLMLSSLGAQQSSQAVPEARDCQFHILADDSFELFINGKLMWKDSDWRNVLRSTLPLQGGDVIVITVTDKQGGKEGKFAAVILDGDDVVASSEDFRYTVKPKANFSTDPNILGLTKPDLQPLNRPFGVSPENLPKRAWTKKADQKFGVVHFKFVVPK